MKCALALLPVLLRAEAAAPSKPHIVFLLADDLGWYDTAVTGDQSPEAKEATSTLVSLADTGVRLSHHYVHWHCSPTRRSFLSGRSPLHHGEQLSGETTDDMDLRWTWISEKLETAGYRSHWYGKGHTGYKSWRHMPTNRGFHQSAFFLKGSGSYTNLERWNGTQPLPLPNKTDPGEYSTDFFGRLAVQAVEQHDPSVPFFMYLPWQAVHGPYDLPPSCTDDTCPNKIRAMIADVDSWTAKVVEALKRKGMYDETLIVFTSDNGGTADGTKEVGGNNYPLRGGKHSQWQGGMRTTTFVSGGLIPEERRGTVFDTTVHVVDWYPTFCHLAGVDAADDAPVAPLPVDMAHPERDIYQGDLSFPSLDGENIWGQLMGQENSTRRYVWLSAQALIKDGRYKIVTGQQLPPLAGKPPTGWRLPNGTWIDGGSLDGDGCGLAFQNREHLRPCLFDLQSDEREMHDLSTAQPELLGELWTELNRSNLTAFFSRSPAELVGHCDEDCATAKWSEIAGGKTSGPFCGVPGCPPSTIV